MATIISSNFYLTNTQMEGNAGLIGYQNLVTPSTISATSQVSTNPITNAANPATAWGWIAGDQPAPADSISYTGTNLASNTNDPDSWISSPTANITNTTLSNPSGEPIVGLVDSSTDSGSIVLTRTDNKSFLAGEYIYFCLLIKDLTDDYTINLQIRETDAISNVVALFPNGTIKTPNVNIDVITSALGDGWALVQGRYLVQNDTTDADGIFYLTGMSIGSQLYVQSLFFGKADDWPAVIATQGIIQDQTITINTAGQEVDYIGIAKHNLNQVGLTVTIKYNGITVVPAQSVSDKQALLFLNNIASPDTVEIIISGATSQPRIAVLYVGKALRLQRNIYVGHTPISYGRKRTAINGVSESGQYLGEIVVREMNMTSVNLQNLTPDWYRQNLDPFFALSPRVPCFWAWRPSKYEDEVGYCWVEGDPQMSNQRSNGMVECSWNFKGIV